MPTTKSLLNATLKSYVASQKAWIGLQGFPNKSKAVSITLTDGESSGYGRYYTASADGYVYVSAYNPTLFSLYGEITSTFHSNGVKLYYKSGFVPVKKGSVFQLAANTDITNLEAKFFPITGGS